MQVQVTDYLCWQGAKHPAAALPPQQVKSCLPQWFADLPANLKQLNLPDDIWQKPMLEDHGYRSAKLCLGLRGIRTLGWTIPLTHSLSCPAGYPGHDGSVGRKEIMLHPAMLTGSRFDAQNNDGQYEWDIRIISFPWRAKMSPGWRLMITAHPLTWSPDWFCFSGCVDSNYRHDGVNIGSFWDFDCEMDLDQNYYNVEIVVAIRKDPARTVVVPANTCLFSMIPIWDPDYQKPRFKEFRNFCQSDHGT